MDESQERSWINQLRQENSEALEQFALLSGQKAELQEKVIQLLLRSREDAVLIAQLRGGLMKEQESSRLYVVRLETLERENKVISQERSDALTEVHKTKERLAGKLREYEGKLTELEHERRALEQSRDTASKLANESAERATRCSDTALAAQRRSEELQVARDAALAKIAQLTSELSRVTESGNSSQALREELSRLKNQLASLQGLYDAANADLLQKRNRIDELVQKHEIVAVSAARLEASVAAMRSNLDAAEARERQTREECQKWQVTALECQQESAPLKEQLARALASLESLQTSYNREHEANVRHEQLYQKQNSELGQALRDLEASRFQAQSISLKYEQLADEMKRVASERDAAIEKSRKLQDKLEAAEQQGVQLSSRLVLTEERLAQFEASNADMLNKSMEESVREAELKERCSHLQASLQTSNDALEQLRKELRVAIERGTIATEEKRTAQARYTDALSQRDKLAAELEHTVREGEANVVKLAQSDQARDQAMSQVQSLKDQLAAEREALKKEIENLVSKLNVSQQAQAQLSAELDTARQTLASERGNSAKLQTELSQLQSVLKLNAEQTINDLTKELQNLTMARDKALSDNAELKSKLDVQLSENSKLSSKLESQARTIEELRASFEQESASRLDALRQIASLTEEGERGRAKYSEAQVSHASESELLRQQLRDLDEAFSRCKKDTSEHVQKLENELSVLQTRLSDLASAKQQLAESGDASTRRLTDELEAAKLRIAELDQLLQRANNADLASKADASRLEQQLADQRRIGESLKVELEQSIAGNKELQKQFDNAKEEFAALEQKLRLRESELLEELAKLQTEFGKSCGDLEGRLSGQERQHASQIQEYDDVVRGLKQHVSELEESSTLTQRKLEALEKQLIEKDEKLHELQIAFDAKEAALKSAAKTREDAMAEIIASQTAKITELEDELARLRNAMSGTSDQASKLLLREEELQRQITTLQQEYQNKLEQRDASIAARDEQLQGATAELTEMRRRLEIAENECNELRSSLKRMELEDQERARTSAEDAARMAKELADAQSVGDAAKAELVNVNLKLHDIQTHLESCQAELSRRQQEWATSGDALSAQIRDKEAELQKEVDLRNRMKTKLKEIADKNKELEAQLDDANMKSVETDASSNTKFEKLANKIRELKERNAQLEAELARETFVDVDHLQETMDTLVKSFTDPVQLLVAAYGGCGVDALSDFKLRGRLRVNTVDAYCVLQDFFLVVYDSRNQAEPTSVIRLDLCQFESGETESTFVLRSTVAVTIQLIENEETDPPNKNWMRDIQRGIVWWEGLRKRVSAVVSDTPDIKALGGMCDAHRLQGKSII